VRRTLATLVIMIGSLVVHLGCEEEDVPYVIDEDEIRAYVQNSPEARQLFRSAGLYPADPYEVLLLNGDTAVYCDSILGHEQRIDPVDMVPLRIPNYNTPYEYDSIRTPDSILLADYGSLGRFREAVATVQDMFTVKTVRILPGDTLVDTTNRTLTRYAFFLKLGDDSKNYVGWVLWGYNGLGTLNAPLKVTVRTSDMQTYTGDLALYDQLPKSRHNAVPKVPFIKLIDIPLIENGSALSLTTDWAGTGNKYDYPLVAADGDGGYIMTSLQRLTREKYTGEVDTRNGTSNRYGFIFLQSFHDDEFFHTRSWCVPYRLY